MTGAQLTDRVFLVAASVAITKDFSWRLLFCRFVGDVEKVFLGVEEKLLTVLVQRNDWKRRVELS